MADTPEQRLDRVEARFVDLDDARVRLAVLEGLVAARQAKVDELDRRLGDQEHRPPRAPVPDVDAVIPIHRLT